MPGVGTATSDGREQDISAKDSKVAREVLEAYYLLYPQIRRTLFNARLMPKIAHDVEFYVPNKQPIE